MTIDINPIIGSIIVAVLVALTGMIWKAARALDRLVILIGSHPDPQSILGRLFVVENHVTDLRDWAITQGYDRRQH